MKVLQVLTAAAGILLVASGPSLAAKRVHHRGVDAYAMDRSGAYNYGPRVSPGQQNLLPNYGHNLPYPDRPYGDPDSW